MKIDNKVNTFYINLDSNPDRKKNMENLLKKYFINYERFPAVNTKTFENLIDNVDKYKKIFNKQIINTDLLNSLENKKDRTTNAELSLGAVGCYLSHLAIYKKIVDENLDYAIILEDDTSINSSPNKFWKIINNIDIPLDTDIFLFDYLLIDSDDDIDKNVKKINFFYQTHFYLITLEGAKKCLELLLPIKVQIDTALSRLSYLQKLNIYGYKNSDLKVYQMASYTNIQISCSKCNIIDEIIQFKKRNNHIIKEHGKIHNNLLHKLLANNGKYLCILVLLVIIMFILIIYKVYLKFVKI